jgi:hypothetical protein
LQETLSIISNIKHNGLVNVTLLDETRHYFGGYYHVKVLAFCDVPLLESYFNCSTDFLDARSRMGESVRFERVLEKMAVPQDEIESVRSRLVFAFNETALAYLAAPDFAERFVLRAYQKLINKSVRSHSVGV